MSRLSVGNLVVGVLAVAVPVRRGTSRGRSRVAAALVAALIAAFAGACATPGEPRAPVTGGAAATAAAAGDPWASGARGDEPPSSAMTRALADRACPRVTGPYFYRVEKAGRASHILGTRHLGVALEKMPDEVRQAAAAAKVAVFEVDPEDKHEAKPAAGPPLSVQLGPELWARYRALVGPANADQVDRGPASTALVVLIALYEHKFAALDLELQALVQKAKIPTVGLESAQFQSKLLDELLDLRMLRATLVSTPDRASLERESVEDLTEFCAGTDDTPGTDEAGRAELRAAGYSEAEIDRMDEVLVYARNADWIPKLEPLLAPGGAFVAVGADHLTGQRGVIAMLAARGWKVERMKPPPAAR